MSSDDATLTLARSLLAKRLPSTLSKAGIASGSAINSAISFCAYSSLVDSDLSSPKGGEESSEGRQKKKGARYVKDGVLGPGEMESDDETEETELDSGRVVNTGAHLKVSPGVTSATHRAITISFFHRITSVVCKPVKLLHYDIQRLN